MCADTDTGPSEPQLYNVNNRADMGVFKRQLVWESCTLAKEGGQYEFRFLKLGTLGITKTRSNPTATWPAASHSLLLSTESRVWVGRIGVAGRVGRNG